MNDSDETREDFPPQSQGLLDSASACPDDLATHESLAAEIAQWRLLVELSPHPVLQIDEHGMVLYYNRASAPLIEAWGDGTRCRVPTDLQNLVSEVLLSDIARITTVHLAAQRVFSLVIHAAPATHSVQMYGLDITGQISITEDLLRENRLMNMLMTHIPDHIYFKDTQSRFIRISHSLAAYFGLKHPRDAIGKTDFDFFGREHAEQAFNDEQQIIRTGQPVIGLVEKETWPDGRVSWVSTTKIPMRDHTGAIVGILGISRDITQRHQLEETVRQQERLAALGQLTGGIAHNFNNSLMAIYLYAEILAEDSALTEEQIESAQAILEEAKDASRLVRQILDFSRQTPVETQRISLGEFIQGKSDMLRHTLPENIRFLIEVPLREIVDEADSTQLQALMMNLVVNARDAMPNGGEIRISVQGLVIEQEKQLILGTLTPGEWACLSVADTGVGIPAEIVPHIFEPFFTTKPKGEGTGLGLSQVYGIVQQYGGQIGIETEVGRGTTMSGYLPVIKEAPRPTKLQSTSAAATAHKGRGECILVAEDEDSLRAAVERMLKRWGYHPIMAANGKDALEVYRSRDDIDLVITDLVMPGMGGIELGEAIHALNPHIPIIYMTGYFLTSDLEALSKRPNSRIVYKPINREEMLRNVREFLEKNE